MHHKTLSVGDTFEYIPFLAFDDEVIAGQCAIEQST